MKSKNMEYAEASGSAFTLIQSRKKKANRTFFKLSVLSLLISYTSASHADKGFNPALLENVGSGEISDLSAFAAGDGQAPGIYTVDISVNNTLVDHREVAFYSDKDKINPEGSGLIPCFTLADLQKYGLNAKAVPELAEMAKAAEAQAKAGEEDEAADKPVLAAPGVKDDLPAQCINFIKLIPSSAAVFDFGKQHLNLSFPQAVIAQNIRGYVDSALWDDGITALLMDYNFTGSNSTNKYGNNGATHDDSYYLNLRSGFNFGAWRLRNYATGNDSNGQRKWESINTYVQRTIAPLKSQLTMGDGNSNADVFDSAQFRGVQLASDDQMRPDSQQGFAPIVRGIAKSNAQVTIKQNGYTIYQDYVSPGAFEITDLYASGDSGDLDITIKEEDGSEQHFVQPYSAVPILQREGQTEYSLAAGQYRGGYGDGDQPDFGQFTLIHGFSRGVTLYGGAQGTENYMATALGIGKNMGELGAVSIDVTQAKTDMPGGLVSKGQSYRFLYSKSFVDSDTDFRLLGYRYSTSGFYTLQESVNLNNNDNDETDYDRDHHKRSQVQGSVSQGLWEGWGSLYLSASMQDYWGVSGKEQTLQAGYNNSWNSISYSFSYSDNHMPGEESDKQIALNVSIPLDRFLSGASANYGMTRNADGHMTQQAGFSGQTMDDRLSYNLNGSTGNQGDTTSGNGGLNYRGQRGNSNVGYSYSSDSQRWNYGLSGGIVAHSGGVTLSQPLGETMVLLAAPGAGGVDSTNDSTVTTDGRGYAILPYATPYRRTNVGLNTTTLGDNVDLSDNVKDVVPTRGAVVRAKFNTHVGYRLIMTLLRSGGTPVPFGATVIQVGGEEDEQNDNTAIVGDAGEAYLSGLPEEGKLLAQWGKGPDQRCEITYKLNPKDLIDTLLAIKADCKPVIAGEK
jgi:outer membrane usher protein